MWGKFEQGALGKTGEAMYNVGLKMQQQATVGDSTDRFLKDAGSALMRGGKDMNTAAKRLDKVAQQVEAGKGRSQAGSDELSRLQKAIGEAETATNVTRQNIQATQARLEGASLDKPFTPSPVKVPEALAPADKSRLDAAIQESEAALGQALQSFQGAPKDLSSVLADLQKAYDALPPKMQQQLESQFQALKKEVEAAQNQLGRDRQLTQEQLAKLNEGLQALKTKRDEVTKAEETARREREEAIRQAEDLNKRQEEFAKLQKEYEKKKGEYDEFKKKYDQADKETQKKMQSELDQKKGGADAAKGQAEAARQPSQGGPTQ
jgi:predicted  nucleic acid-binding Zn-ribbon protein